MLTIDVKGDTYLGVTYLYMAVRIAITGMLELSTLTDKSHQIGGFCVL